jgi:hypothetical protein
VQSSSRWVNQSLCLLRQASRLLGEPPDSERGTAEQWIKEGKNTAKWTKLSCLQAKDDAGYPEACAAIIAWQRSDPTVVWNAVSAASVFALAPKGIDDYRVPMGWMESRLAVVPALRPSARHACSNALGGLLLRAGRLDKAIVRINEGMAAEKDVQIPIDWTYLALAHARKGKLAEARQMLFKPLHINYFRNSALLFWHRLHNWFPS